MRPALPQGANRLLHAVSMPLCAANELQAAAIPVRPGTGQVGEAGGKRDPTVTRLAKPRFRAELQAAAGVLWADFRLFWTLTLLSPQLGIR